MYRNTFRGALLASTAFVMFGTGPALAQAGGSCTTTDGAQVCEGDQPTVNAYSFGLDSFTNTGTLNSAFLYLYRGDTPFTFLNSATGIISTGTGTAPSVAIFGSNWTSPFDVASFVNEGFLGSTVGAAVFVDDSVAIGSFDNSGTIAATGEGHTAGGCFFAEDSGVEIRGTVGDFNNSGTITGTDTGVYIAVVSGNFTNSGLIAATGGEAFGDTAVRLGSIEGNFTNEADGVISGFVDGVDLGAIGGDFINYGHISGTVEGYTIGSLDGDFLNFGLIESTEDYGQGAGWIGYLGGSFVNGADAQILSQDYGIAISTMNGPAFTNAGLISSVYHAVQIRFPASSFTFTNTGDILASNGSGVILQSGYGPGAEGQTSLGIQSYAPAGEVTFINEGDIVASQDGVSAYSVLATFENSGLIDGGVTGAYISEISGSFSNTGDIIGGATGVGIDYLLGDFVNDGLIEAVRGYVIDRQAPSPGDSIPTYNDGIGAGIGYLDGDFINNGTIRGATIGAYVHVLSGDFINDGLIESTLAAETAAIYNSGGDYASYYQQYAVNINVVSSGGGAPANAGIGSAIGAEELSFFNSQDGQILGMVGGVRIGSFSGPGFYNGGLISSTFDAVTIERAYTDYIFTNYGDILSSEGDGVSLGNFSSTPSAEPLGLAAAGTGGLYSPAVEMSFFNGGNIIAGGIGVDIGHDVFLFENEGLISGGRYGVRISGPVYGFVNMGTITASDSGTPPPPPQRPYAESISLAAPALSSRASGEGVRLDFVEGGIVNGPDASIAGNRLGLSAYVVGNMFLNYGTISGGYQGISVYAMLGDFLNDGLIEQTLATEDSEGVAVSFVFFDGDEGFHNTVDGEILSQGAGVYVYEFLRGDFLNDGLISSVGDAVSLQFIGGERAFENNGDITSTEGVGVFLTHSTGGGCGMAPLGAVSSPCARDALDPLLPAAGLTFLNTGTIYSSVLGVRIDGLVSLFENRGDITSDGKVGADLYRDVETLINYGTITGAQTAVRINDNLAYMYNAGSITGLTGGESGTGAGLRVYGDAGTFLINATDGIISGFTGVVLGDGDDDLVNAGILTGTGGVAASLGGGDDTFVSHGIGSISGAVDGGADYDTFIASGTQTLDMEINNFEALWLVGGDITFGRNHSANYMLSNGDALDLVGFTFTGGFLNLADLYATGGSVDGSVVNFGNILALDLTITGDLYNGGVINPGGTGAIGTLTVLGDFYALNIGDSYDLPGGSLLPPSQAAATLSPSSSTLVFNFSGLTHDQIIVTGAATLGGDLLVTGDLGEAITSRQDFTLISAASMSGNYNLLNIGGVLFTPEIGRVGSKLLLSFAQNNFTASLNPSTFNQSQAALGLEDRWTLGASAADDIVLALNAGAAPAPILEAFAPETSAALTRQSARIGTQLAQTVANCAIGPNAGACGRRESDGALMLWTNVSTSGARIEGDGNAAQVDEAFTQVSSGAEMAFNDRFTGGVFLASGTGDVDVADGGRGHGEIDSVAGGVYGRMQAGRFTLAGLAGYADTDIEARRQTPLGTSIGETGGSVSFARLDARLTLVSGVDQAGFLMSGTYAYAEIGNFAQRGADGYDLDIVGDSFRVEDWELRGFFGHQFQPTQAGYLWSYGATAGLVNARGEDMASVAASFPGGSAPHEALGPVTDGTGRVASGYIDLTSPLVGVTAQLGVEGRWIGGEHTSSVYGRFAWTF
tara:strand:- start:2133 stop:7250 length:5118 start_codon:yes stop_codon:yes gene_type:complete